jgi:alcohol dehydrogenase (cytochrome c)
MRAVLQGRAGVISASKSTALIFAAAGIAIAFAATGGSTPAAQAPQAARPDPRQATFERMCSTCHEPERVETVRESAAGWTRIVDDMVTRGAEGSPDEIRDVIAFLADHYGTSSAGGRGDGAALARPERPRLAVTGAFEARCSSCHGPTMTGGPAASGPSILSYIRYHTNGEVAAVIKGGHAGTQIQLTDDELLNVLNDVRALGGTDPVMATGGYTGQRGREPQGPTQNFGRGRGSRGEVTGVIVESDEPSTITLSDGKTATGLLRAQSEFNAVLVTDDKIQLLSKNEKDNGRYREKKIEPKADWLNYHGAIGAGRYSPLELINKSNISKLSVAWMFPMPNSSRLEVTPVVADGVMYATGWNEIYALDATTGRQIWHYSEPRHPGLLSEAGTGANRGPAISGERVFMITDHAHLLAFNRFTGKKLWDTEMGSVHDGYSATVSPLAVGDVVFQGVAGGEEGARGFVDAYRASTGERLWRFYTIPKRGEPGSETWIGHAIDHGCGATWQTGSYDPQLDLVYWGVGNPCPDYTGDERLGDNLYTASVIALSGKTGELKWHYQFTPHDTHDWDSAQPMVLVDDNWQGKPRKLLMTANRNGMFYVLDRTNGEFLQGSKLSTKVTWLKGFEKNGRPIVDPGSISTREGVAVCPGGGGGANMPDVSYSPITKLFYVRMSDTCGLYVSGDDPLSGSRWFGRGRGASPEARKALEDLQADYPRAFYIRAMDPFTGKKVWDYPMAFGHEGVMSTAGGLVFLGTPNGGLTALDAKNGKLVWHLNVGQPLTEASPMTYMVQGKQYIALPGVGMMIAYALVE